jgi:hypothetical protein
MRLSREQFFDLVELVGKAVVTARLKPADDSWLDEMVPGWLRAKKPRRNPKAHTPGQDEFGLLDGTPWSSQEDESERTDLVAVAPGAGDFGFAAVERARAERAKREFGDGVSTELWTIQRKVSLGGYTVTEGMTLLMELCRRLSRMFISEGWANTLTRIIDRASH